jgi:hypothetical protein
MPRLTPSPISTLVLFGKACCALEVGDEVEFADVTSDEVVCASDEVDEREIEAVETWTPA